MAWKFDVPPKSKETLNYMQCQEIVVAVGGGGAVVVFVANEWRYIHMNGRMV